MWCSSLEHKLGTRSPAPEPTLNLLSHSSSGSSNWNNTVLGRQELLAPGRAQSLAAEGAAWALEAPPQHGRGLCKVNLLLLSVCRPYSSQGSSKQQHGYHPEPNKKVPSQLPTLTPAPAGSECAHSLLHLLSLSVHFRKILTCTEAWKARDE